MNTRSWSSIISIKFFGFFLPTIMTQPAKFSYFELLYERDKYLLMLYENFVSLIKLGVIKFFTSNIDLSV